MKIWGIGVLLALLRATELPIALVGVAVDAAVPSKSVCMVRCTAAATTSATSIVGVGQRACDVAEVTEVRQDVVIIKNLLTNKVETLSFRRNAGPAPVPPPSPAPAAPSVVKRSATGVTVDVPKAAVDHYLLNLTELLTAALATPHFQDGGTGPRVMDGFQLGEIKPGSVIEQLGLRNGDIITEVNGEKLDSVAVVIRLAGQVQNIGQAKMLVIRAGKPMTFVFNTK